MKRRFFDLILGIVFSVAVALALLSCDQESGKVINDPEFQYRSGGRFVVRVHLFDTREELNVAYQGLVPDGRNMLGYSIAQRNISTLEPNFCDIFVVKTPYASDQELVVWGHELKHCLEGDFHKENLDR